MNKTILAIVLMAVVLTGAVYWYFSIPTRESASIVGSEAAKSDLIKISFPRPNDTVESPIVIKGEARGFWFFEASFPVKLLDENGNVVAMGVAQAQGDWMTEDFVPFEAELNFVEILTGTGTLILEKDNPSGLPEYADELRIQVKFKAPQDTIVIKAYFNNDKMDPEFSCNKVFPTERRIKKTQAVARAALEELLKGPSPGEKAEGYFTSLNPGVKIQKLTIENGTARVDFDATLESQVGGSCRVAAIRAQITETLNQFPGVQQVIISIDGRTEDILQP